MPSLKASQPYTLKNSKEEFISRSAEEPTQEILETLAAAVYKCDRNGYVTFYNKAAAELWGREPELGKDLWCGSWKIYEPDGVTPVPLDACPMAIALKEGRPVRGIEIMVERPDGQRINVMPYPDPVFDRSGNIVESINMLVDITDIKKKENELRESENKYRILAEVLQSALKTEEEFISIASHELKTPITSLNLYLQVLLQAHTIGDDDNTTHLLKRSKVQVDRLIKLLGDLLDATKIKAGKLALNFEDVCLNGMLEDVINDYSSTLSAHSIIKTGKSTTLVRADKSRIEQVLTNLLTNAVKYSPRSNKIIVSISEDENNVKVSVQDFGIGISKKNLDKVFNRFFRAHVDDGEMLSSLGLGLYISSDIISRHHGKIWVDSDQGKGSTFYFSLPK